MQGATTAHLPEGARDRVDGFAGGMTDAGSGVVNTAGGTVKGVVDTAGNTVRALAFPFFFIYMLCHLSFPSLSHHHHHRHHHLLLFRRRRLSSLLHLPSLNTPYIPRQLP